MDYYQIGGTWWFPDSPDNKVPGKLTFDADDLNLVVYGSLVPMRAAPGEVFEQEGPPDWEVTPFIHGRTYDTKRVTLLDAGGANLIGPSVSQSSYRPRLALANVHVQSDLFVEAWCAFDCLTAWAEPPEIAEDVKRTETGWQFDLRLENVELCSANVGDVQVRLSGVRIGDVGSDRVTVDQDAMFVISTPPMPVRSIVEDWIRPLQDFLILALGRPVRLTTLLLKPQNAGSRDDLAVASFEAVQPVPGPAPSRSALMSYSAPTLLTLRDCPAPFADLLPRWFPLREELREVFALLHGPYYATFMFTEHRYSSTFQSTEALAKIRGFAGQEKTRAKHRERVDAIVSAAESAGVDVESVNWAKRVLQGRNDKSLGDQITDLVLSTGRIGEAVLEASPRFGHLTATARTGTSHGGADKALDSEGLFWHADVLRWIVRARILMDLDLDVGEIEKRVLDRTGFTYSLDEIRKYAARGGEQ